MARFIASPHPTFNGRWFRPKHGEMTRLRGILAVTLWLSPTLASAQLEVRARLTLPSIRFEVAPPLVEVSEGVQVVPEYEEEVFYTDGWYWCRNGGGWYRTRNYRGGWVLAEPRYVPVALVRIPPGKYKHHKGGGKAWGRRPPGQVTEVKVKEKHGYTEVKVKNKGPKGHGRWK
jgi:hypothetical protein